ncbi:hypothetical protein F-VV10_0100 [Faustovirus]|nr:hypothetical protein F-VV10_0100 [Faustovirus]
MVVICEFEGCDNVALFGTKENPFTNCKNHKNKGQIRYRWKVCGNIGCKKHAGFGIDKPLTCSEHKLPNYIDMTHKKCSSCGKNAKFKGENNSWFCKEHSINKIVEDKSSRKKCNAENCNDVAYYNIKGQPPNYCNKHKAENMVDSKCCIEDGCLKSAGFGNKGGKKEYCNTHKRNNMVYIGRKLCRHKGCDGTATYGEKDTKTRLYCAEHGKLYDNMVLIRPSCEKCERPRVYGFDANLGATRCPDHKLEGMKKLIHRKCNHEGCTKTANFVDANGKFCGTHKPDSAKKQKAKCQICKEEATRGPIFGKLIRCLTHAEKNHLTKHKINPQCKGEKCKDKPVFGYKGTSNPEYCDTHKLENMVNIIERPCASCKLTYLIPDGIDLCEFCYVGQKIVKEKEEHIKQLLDAKGVKYDSYNKVVDINCSNKRPDFVIDYNTFFVIIEVDENQHKSYQRDCELTRMKQIHQSMGMDTLFIRFNPDTYIDTCSKKIKSYSGRETKLIKLLETLRNVEKLEHYLMVIYLFYDGFDGKINMQKIEY